MCQRRFYNKNPMRYTAQYSEYIQFQFCLQFHPANLRYIPDLPNFSVEMKHSLDIRHCQEIISKPF